MSSMPISFGAVGVLGGSVEGNVLGSRPAGMTGPGSALKASVLSAFRCQRLPAR